MEKGRLEASGAIRTADGALVVFRAIQLADLGTHTYITHIRDESNLTQVEKDAAKEWIDAFYVCSYALMLNSLHIETFEISRNTVTTKGSYLRELKNANGAYKYSDDVRELIRKAMLACQEAGTGCFIKGTLIAEERDLVPIEKITKNSKVWSWDTEKKQRILQNVSNVFVRTVKQLTHIFVGKEKISTTPEHPFYNGAAWIDAKNLKKGTKVLLFSTLLASVDSIYTQDTICTVYNFEVEGTHNYFVGENGVLAHNADCKFYQKLLVRIEGNSNFAMIHSSQEVADIAATGKSLGLTDDVIDDLLFISCRSKDSKSIAANELMVQMDTYVNTVLNKQKRGYPFKFASKADFNNFSTDFKVALQSLGLSVDDVCIQGSALRKQAADDLDNVCFISESSFESKLKNYFANKISKNGQKIDISNYSHTELEQLSKDIDANPTLYNNPARVGFNYPFKKKMISTDAFDEVIPNMKTKLGELQNNYKHLNIKTLSVQVRGGEFDLKPVFKI